MGHGQIRTNGRDVDKSNWPWLGTIINLKNYSKKKKKMSCLIHEEIKVISDLVVD